MISVASAGCRPTETVFRITDHPVGAAALRYHERFDECYYFRHPEGTVEVVARRTSRQDENGEPITQVVHIRNVWPTILGTTHAERTMINSTVAYMIASPGGGSSFEGGGFFTHQQDQAAGALTGVLESSSVLPQRRVGAGHRIFERAEVTGTVVAVEDKRRAQRILNDMDRLLGPKPAYRPPPPPDVR